MAGSRVRKSRLRLERHSPRHRRKGWERGVHSAPHSDTNVHTISTLAIGDVDEDGRPEIVAIGPGDASRDLLIFEHDGVLKTRILDVITVRPFQNGDNGPYLLAGQDGEAPEIVVGDDIRGVDGLRPVPISGGTLGGGGTIATDLQLDGRVDLISGPIGHAIFGTFLSRTWTAQQASDLELSTSRVAVATFPNLTTGPHPSVVHVLKGGDVSIMNADGQRMFAFSFPGAGAPTGRQGGPPLIADFDGDGQAEIAVAGEQFLVVYDIEDARGSSTPSETTTDSSFGRLGATAHDFDGDGEFEIVYAGERSIRMFKYAQGSRSLETIWSASRPSETNQEYPTIADIDADGRAEIIAGSDFGGGGVVAYGHPGWTGARRIWNQYDYHVDNIEEDGTIPTEPRSGWREHKTFRGSVPTHGVRSAPDLTVSMLRVVGPQLSGTYSMTVRVGNAGGLTVGPDIPVLFEVDGNPVPSGEVVLGQALASGEFADITVGWLPPRDPSGSRARIVANPEGVDRIVPDVELKFRECRYGNNILTAGLDLFIDPPTLPTDTPTPTPVPEISPTPTDETEATSTSVPPPIALYLPVAFAEHCDPDGTELDLVVVVDVSAGMRSSLGSFSTLKEGFETLFTTRTEHDDRIAGVAFASDIVDSIGFTGSPSPFLSWLEGLDGLGMTEPGTAIHSGLREAGRLLGEGPVTERTPLLVLISDGREDRRSARESGRVANSLRAQGIIIWAIAHGPRVNRAALIELASSARNVETTEVPSDVGWALINMASSAACQLPVPR